MPKWMSYSLKNSSQSIEAQSVGALERWSIEAGCPLGEALKHWNAEHTTQSYACLFFGSWFLVLRGALLFSCSLVLLFPCSGFWS